MGIDVALMLGIAHTLVENGWQDEAFLARYTTGYDRFADYLLGGTDGTAKTAEWAAEICGVSAAKIRELAEIFHHNTTMLMAGWGNAASAVRRAKALDDRHACRNAGANWYAWRRVWFFLSFC